MNEIKNKAKNKVKDIYSQRRIDLCENIKQKYPGTSGALLLFADFEHHKYKFRQESSFYYLTGLQEPAIVLVDSLDINKLGINKLDTKLFVPVYGESREKWLSSSLYGASQEELERQSIEQIENLGKPCSSYALSHDSDIECYKNLIEYLKSCVEQKNYIFTLYKDFRYRDQRVIINRLLDILPELKDYIIDISDRVAAMRCKKSKEEIVLLYNAINCTIEAQEMALSLIKPGKKEYNIQAGIDFVFTNYGARSAFPSIVASGKNSVILHSCENTYELNSGDLVIVDIGAELDYYCADLTRTYPVSGKYTRRQKDIYNLVLDTQSYIADKAAPGYWIKNNNEPEKSLHHLACKYLEKYGYNSYFTHGIGHYLGMDVHDVGDYTQPLEEGNVITIEPGIYIKEENIGIRIEDDYWIVKNGSICLSEDLPKNILDIEKAMDTP